MIILVTGASGFLGSHLARRLIHMGYKVTGTGRDVKKLESLAEVQVNCVQGDLSDFDFTKKLVQGHDVVIHCAALSAPWGRKKDFVRSNVTATENLVDACILHGIKRFIHVSSPSLYFSFKDQFGLTEGSKIPKQQINHYSESKLIAERVVLSSNLPSVVIRPRGIIGPGDPSIIPRVIELAKQQKLPILGGGKSITDLTYIDNAVEALVCALHANSSVDGEVFNITNDSPVHLWRFLEKLLDGLGIPRPERHYDHRILIPAAFLMEYIGKVTGREPPFLRYSIGLLAYSQTFNIHKAKSVLGYQPIVSMDDALNRIVSYHKDAQTV